MFHLSLFWSFLPHYYFSNLNLKDPKQAKIQDKLTIKHLSIYDNSRFFTFSTYTTIVASVVRVERGKQYNNNPNFCTRTPLTKSQIKEDLTIFSVVLEICFWRVCLHLIKSVCQYTFISYDHKND